MKLLLSCEHAGNRVPEEWNHLFAGRGELLASHWGYDPGAMELAETIRHRTGAELFTCMTTRLLVEANRTPPHPELFSSVTRNLPRQAKEEILENYWRPYRDRLVGYVLDELKNGGSILHLSIHTFTPFYKGIQRSVEIGVLDDPTYLPGREVSERWLHDLRLRLPQLSIRRNRPYLGRTDSRIRELRIMTPRDRYIGLELEVSQGLLHSSDAPKLRSEIAESCAELALRLF